MVALGTLGVQFLKFSFKDVMRGPHLPLTGFMKNWNWGSVLMWKVDGKFNSCDRKSLLNPGASKSRFPVVIQISNKIINK